MHNTILLETGVGAFKADFHHQSWGWDNWGLTHSTNKTTELLTYTFWQRNKWPGTGQHIQPGHLWGVWKCFLQLWLSYSKKHPSSQDRSTGLWPLPFTLSCFISFFPILVMCIRKHKTMSPQRWPPRTNRRVGIWWMAISDKFLEATWVKESRHLLLFHLASICPSGTTLGNGRQLKPKIPCCKGSKEDLEWPQHKVSSYG